MKTLTAQRTFWINGSFGLTKGKILNVIDEDRLDFIAQEPSSGLIFHIRRVDTDDATFDDGIRAVEPAFVLSKDK